MDALQLVRHVYSDSVDFSQQTLGYVESGKLVESTYFHTVTIKELFPVASPSDFHSLYGITVPDMSWLLRNRLVRLLVQEPSVYADLQFLGPLFEQPDGVVCYEIRDKVIYDVLSAGRYAEHLEAGYRNPILSLESPHPEDLREEYESLVAPKQARWGQRTVQRYAALCALCSKELIDEVLQLHQRGRGSPKRVRSVRERLFLLHRLLLHPLSQC